MTEQSDEFEHVGSFAPYGLDGCGALGGVDIFVRVEDTDKGTNYAPDDSALWAENTRLRAALADIGTDCRYEANDRRCASDKYPTPKQEWCGGCIAWAALSGSSEQVPE